MYLLAFYQNLIPPRSRSLLALLTPFVWRVRELLGQKKPEQGKKDDGISANFSPVRPPSPPLRVCACVPGCVHVLWLCFVSVPCVCGVCEWLCLRLCFGLAMLEFRISVQSASRTR